MYPNKKKLPKGQTIPGFLVPIELPPEKNPSRDWKAGQAKRPSEQGEERHLDNSRITESSNRWQ